MRYIELSRLDKKNLAEAYRNYPKFHVRNRSKALLMSAERYQVKAIAFFFKVRTRTIYTWMDRFEKEGIIGILLKPGRGLKPTLSIKDKDIVDKVKKSPVV